MVAISRGIAGLDRSLTISVAIIASFVPTIWAATPITVLTDCSDFPSYCEYDGRTLTVIGTGEYSVDESPVWNQFDVWVEEWERWEDCVNEYEDEDICTGMGLVQPDEYLFAYATVTEGHLDLLGHRFVTKDFKYGYWFDWSYIDDGGAIARWLAVGDADYPDMSVGDPGLLWYIVEDGQGLSYFVNGYQGGHEVESDGSLYFLNREPDFDLQLKLESVAGCKSVTGTVTLSRPAPLGGVNLEIGDSLIAAVAPSNVFVAEGSLSKSFRVGTVPVSLSEAGKVYATLNRIRVRRDLTVRPMGVRSIALSPSPVVGSNDVTGTVKLECAAGPGPISVELGTSDASVANPVATSIVVPQAATSGKFTVATNPVQGKTAVTLSAKANGIEKSKRLWLQPAATVSPLSLKFGDAAVGSSKVLNATLLNKGAVPYSIVGISIDRDSSGSFSQTNNCSATLGAQQSCTISVTFKPTSEGSKTGQLKIDTTARSLLIVKLSGTGVLPP